MEEPNRGLLKQFYREMLRIRRVEERIADLYPEQEMRCPVHLCIGQEAVAVGVSSHLSQNDYALSSHRSHGHYLAKGGNLKALFAELYGKATGCSRGKGGSMHLADLAAGFLGSTPIVGSILPIAVGVSFGSVLRGEKRIVVVFFGEAATEEGVFHESINFAVLKKLPIVFVCENNLYSVYSPLSVRRTRELAIHALMSGYGVTSVQGDGNDVAAVSRLSGQVIKRAREGQGPSFLELKTYRWREHCGPHYDNNLGYRTEQEFEEWKKRCPIKSLEEQLLKDRILDEQDVRQIESDLKKEIDQAVSFAKESPFPTEERLLEDIYAS